MNALKVPLTVVVGMPLGGDWGLRTGVATVGLSMDEAAPAISAAVTISTSRE